jgi:hypothetical protein
MHAPENRAAQTERGIYVDAQRFLHPVLADEFGQALGTER